MSGEKGSRMPNLKRDLLYNHVTGISYMCTTGDTYTTPISI